MVIRPSWGVVTVGGPVEVQVGGVCLSLVRGDITCQAVDAIVNAANPSLRGGGGVDGAIHRAGGPAILAECLRIVAERGPLPPGQAVLTTAGKLPARRVIHTVGPVWRGGQAGEAEALARAYRESLALAAREGMQSIAFPSLSTGAYGYPVPAAAEVALGTVLATRAPLREVRFVLYDDETYQVYAVALERLLHPAARGHVVYRHG
ncbi:MAG: O-acetyl-ADP-ribose deacetylase [Chloroflexi bacterium]|nr:O-acetyl-ADP-ribose deacetylase [Chloroflexota bacterium]